MEILGLLYGYDSFLDSLKVICDMGAGAGLDAQWWATLETRDELPEPRNYRVYAVDKNFNSVEPDVKATPGVRWLEKNFEDEYTVPEKIDLLWSHDSFQYAVNPMGTLANWNKMMNKDAMLVMALPQQIGYVYNRLTFKTENYSYHNYTISNLVYMLAVNGFDCRDAYFYKNAQTNWIYLAVYKMSEPMDPSVTSLHDLAQLGYLNNSCISSINAHGHLRQEDIIYPWLDKDFYQAKI